jgi:hypothetical protein
VLCLKRLHFAGGLEQLELVVDALHASYALNRVDDVIELISKRDAAKGHTIIVGKDLNPSSMLDIVIELRAHSGCELVICLWHFLGSRFCTLPRAGTCFTQQQRRPDPEARYQSDLLSTICHCRSTFSVGMSPADPLPLC